MYVIECMVAIFPRRVAASFQGGGGGGGEGGVNASPNEALI